MNTGKPSWYDQQMGSDHFEIYCTQIYNQEYTRLREMQAKMTNTAYFKIELNESFEQFEAVL